MSTVLGDRSLPHARPSGAAAWMAVLAGLLLLYVPTYADLSRGLWRDEEYAHGPIVVAVFAWLAWRMRGALLDEASRPARLAGAAALAFGLALYLLGRTQSLTVFEVASHLPVIAGAVLLLRGWGALRRLAFPILFLLFLVPLPGFVLEQATTPLKAVVSASVEALLGAAGYPVERSGVVLAIGEHQMLVADACSGLNSLYSLFALGLLYTHLTGPRSLARTLLALLAIVPIAVAANIVRVAALVLITYHDGEEAAQGFLHGSAGMLVFIVSLLLLVAFDRGVQRVLPSSPRDPHVSSPRAPQRGNGPGPNDWAPAFAGVTSKLAGVTSKLAGVTSKLAGVTAALAMAATAAAAPVLKPVPAPGPAADLERILPAAFAGWTIDPDVVPIAPAPDVQSRLDRIYRQVVSRTYVNAAGERMMLTVAHGGDQSDALKAHRQEACYAAQGFEIRGLEHGTFSAAGRTIPVTRMHAVRGERSEPVTYWFTMGDRVVLGRLERLRVQLENGLAGRVPDGMLVRVSSLSNDPRAAFGAQEAFMAAALAAVPANETGRFLGRAQD